MLIIPVTYTDYNGVERTEKLHFNLTKAEAIKMEMSTDGGMSAMIQRIVDEKNAPEIIRIFEDMIKKSYGVVSPDGKKFVKNETVWEEFSQSEAYSEMFMKLISDEEEMIKFVNGIMPADVVAEAQKQGLMPAIASAT